MIWVGVLYMFLAFFVYLLMAGAGMRALEVVARSALAGLALGIFMSALPFFFTAKLDHGGIGYGVFMHFAILGSVVALAMESARRARDYLVAKSSTFEVVCLNVLAVAFGAPPDSFAFFDILTEAGYFLLVNPLGPWLPADPAWLKTILSLWPSAIALWAASQGEQAGRVIRLFLMWWVQLMYATWVLPASFEILIHSGDASGYIYLDLLLGAIGMVRVLLTMLSLFISLRGSTDDDSFDLPAGETAKTAFRRSLVDGMVVLPLPGWAYAVGGCCAYVLVNLAQHFLTPEMAVTSGFFTILGVSALIQALWRRWSPVSTLGLGNALAGNVLLVGGLLILSALPLLPRYVRSSAPRAAAPERPAQTQPTVAQVSSSQPVREAPSARELELEMYPTAPYETADCEIKKGEELLLTCAAETWPLGALAHPARVQVPSNLGAPSAAYTFGLSGENARCVEYMVLEPVGEPREVLLLVFRSGASLESQVGWVTGPEADCRQLRLAVFSDTPEGEPTVLFAADQPRLRRDLQGWEKVVTLRSHPTKESAISQ